MYRQHFAQKEIAMNLLQGLNGINDFLPKQKQYVKNSIYLKLLKTPRFIIGGSDPLHCLASLTSPILTFEAHPPQRII